VFNPKRIVVLVVLVYVTVACGDSDEPAPPGRVAVVVTTTMLGDLVRNVVGNDGDVDVLIPAGVDPHEFQASARQVAAIVSADLVVANGIRLEQGFDDVLDSASADGANVLRVGELVDPQFFHGQDSSSELDPHVWLDPLRMAEAAEIVGSELALLNPGFDWVARAADYAKHLRDVDVEIQGLLAAVPPDRRILVTNHDSMGYFATRYGFDIVGVVVPGGSTLAEPSSAAIADLVARVIAADVPAIFAETTEPTLLAEAVAAEVGRDVTVIELYTGSLGESGSGAETLIGMLVTNARRIVAALS